MKKSKRFKKFISVILSLVLCAVLLPVRLPVMAMPATVTASYYDPITGTDTTRDDVIEVYPGDYDLDNSTLTLDTAGADTWYLLSGTINFTNMLTIDTSDGDVNLILENGCNVTVTGAIFNAIYVTGPNNLNIYAQSGGTPGKLSITGDATLNGIKTDNGSNVTINGGTIDITAGGPGITANNDVIINGGVINISAQGAGITANNDITVSSGAVTISAGYIGIYAGNSNNLVLGGGMGNSTAYGNVTISGGVIDITSDNDAAIHARNDVTISSGNVTLTGNVGIQGNTIDISGGNTIITSGTNSAGIGCNSINISGGTVSINSDSIGIGVINDITISDGTVDITTTDGEGIYSFNNVTISGGNITVNGAGVMAGIVGGSSVAISGGKIVENGTGAGIIGNSVSIGGGKIYITTASDFGIFANTSIIINSGTLDITSADKDGIFADNVTISGGSGTVKTLDTSGDCWSVTSSNGLTVGAGVSVKGSDGTAYNIPVKSDSYNGYFTFVNVNDPSMTLQNIQFSIPSANNGNGYPYYSDSDYSGSLVSGPSGTSANNTSTNTGDNKVTTDTNPTVTVNINGQDYTAVLMPDGTVELTISADDVSKDKDNTGNLDITAPGQNKIIVTIPADAVVSIDGSLVINTDFGALTISNETLKALQAVFGEFPIRLSIVKGSFKVALIDSKGNDIKYDDPQNPLTITLPYTLTDGQKAECVVAVRKGTAANVVIPYGVYNTETKSITFDATRTGEYDAIYNEREFNDISGNWAEKYIDFITARGLADAMDANGDFEPGMPVSRAMFANMFANLERADLSKYTTSNFDDVKSGQWYFGAVEWAADNGIMDGTGDGKFEPNKLVTREEMSVMLDRYVKYKGWAVKASNEKTAFADDGSISDWAAEAVSDMQQAGIITGKPGNIYDPQGITTRAEYATIFARLIQAYGK
ncbi:MAG: S-layer homology domain-containing protein [Oscillospiraceae bacterium]|nr:S-layer homology domain-containing protein [Oscillospiraceae bacterium]